MAGFVLRRTTPSPQLYVAPPGSLFSYTRDKSKARVYPTRDAAEADRCENETIEPL